MTTINSFTGRDARRTLAGDATFLTGGYPGHRSPGEPAGTVSLERLGVEEIALTPRCVGHGPGECTAVQSPNLARTYSNSSTRDEFVERDSERARQQ